MHLEHGVVQGAGLIKQVESYLLSVAAATLVATYFLVGSTSLPASAVTSPSSGSLSVTAPFTVTWNGVGVPSSPVDILIDLDGASSLASVMQLPLALGVANSGQYTVALPVLSTLMCNGKLPFDMPKAQWVSRMRVQSSNNSSVAAVGLPFKFKCPLVLSTGPLPGPAIVAHENKSRTQGILQVYKVVINATGGPVPVPPSFPMLVECAPNLAQSISVAPGATGTSVPVIAAPALCVVTEPPVRPILGVEGCKGGNASWASLVIPQQGLVVPASGRATITVRNTLTCDKK